MTNIEFVKLIETLCNTYLRCKRFEYDALDKDGYFKGLEFSEHAPSGEFGTGFKLVYVNGVGEEYPVLEYKNTLSDIESGHSDTLKQYAKKMRQEWLNLVSGFLFNYIGFESFIVDSYKGTLG